MKQKFFLLIITGFLLLGNLAAQVRLSLSGKITDVKTGEPLTGASIYFPDLRAGAASNNEGLFNISNLSAGKYLVEVSHLGYSTIIETIQLGADTKRDFKLNPSIIENETAIVTGVSTATSVKKTPIPVNIIKRADLFNNTSTNLVDNLSKTPGVTQLSTGPAVSKPFIRGLGYNRVIVMNDGIRHEAQQWGDEHGIEIDEQSVFRVEVLKGPASLMYGSDALAGVINIISVQPPPEGTIKGNILTGYQFNNRQRNLHGSIGGSKHGFIWGIYGSFKSAADYKNKFDGYVFNSKFNEKNYGGYVGINKNWGFTHLLISHFKQFFGLVEGDRDDATGKFLKLINDNGTEAAVLATDKDFRSTDPYTPRQHLLHLKIASDNSFNIGKDRLGLVLAYQQDQRHELGDVLNREENTLYFHSDIFNYSAQYHFAEKNNFRTTVGLNGMLVHHVNKAAEAVIPDYSAFDLGVFLYTRKTINKTTFSGGIRLDNRSIDSKELMEGPDIKFAAFNKNFINVSMSAGLACEASKTVTLKFNIARGFRAPAIPELASNGAHEGTNRYEYGTQGLKSETSLQSDAGIEISGEHVSFNANLFYNAISNFIYYRKLESVAGGDSVIIDGSEQFFAFRFNQDNAKMFGFEFNLDIHPHPLDWLHIENTFSWVRGQLNKAQDGSRNLPFIPAGRLINELKADISKKSKTLKNAFIKLELDNTFAQNHPFSGFNTESATPGYSLLNAGLGSDFLNKGKTIFSLFIGANNITDVAYQNHLSRLKYAPVNMITGRMGVFNMGRNFSVKLNIPIGR